MPEAYPPRPRDAADVALEALRRAVEARTRGTICLTGTLGPRRTEVLHALAAHLSPSFRAVHLTDANLPTGGLWIRIAQALDFTPGYDARRRVLHHLSDLVRKELALLLLIEDADPIPAESLYSLLSTARTEPGFHLVLAASDERSLAGPLPDDVTQVRLDDPPRSDDPPTEAVPIAAAPREPPPGLHEPASAIPPEPPEREPGPPAPEAPPIAREPVAPALMTAEPFAGEPTYPAPYPDPTAPEPPARSRGAAAAPPDAQHGQAAEAIVRLASRRLRRERHRRVAWGLAGLALGAALGVLLAGDAWWTRFKTGPLAPEAELQPAVPPAAAQAPAAAPHAAPPVPTPVAGAPPVAAPPPPSAPAGAAPAGAMQAPFPQDAAPAHPAAEPPPEAEARVSAPPPPAAAPVTRAPAPAARAPVAARTPPERAPQRQEAPLAYGTLRIESGSPVVIEIDGRPYGPTPLSGLRLPRGEHRVIAHYADGSVAQKTITLDEEDVSIFYR